MNKSVLRQEGEGRGREHPRNVARHELNHDLDADGEEGFSQYNSSNGGAFNLVTNNIKSQYNKEPQAKRQSEQMKSTPSLLHKIDGPIKVPEVERKAIIENADSPPLKNNSVMK